MSLVSLSMRDAVMLIAAALSAVQLKSLLKTPAPDQPKADLLKEKPRFYAGVFVCLRWRALSAAHRRQNLHPSWLMYVFVSLKGWPRRQWGIDFRRAALMAAPSARPLRFLPFFWSFAFRARFRARQQALHTRCFGVWMRFSPLSVWPRLQCVCRAARSRLSSPARPLRPFSLFVTGSR